MKGKLGHTADSNSVIFRRDAYEKHLSRVRQKSREYHQAAKEILLETLWPTRCVICDLPGSLLCDTCRIRLPYIDYCYACQHCGGPFGRIQCSECNPVSLKDLGVQILPFTACVNVVTFDSSSARIIASYKDRNEKGLARAMAVMVAHMIPPSWIQSGNSPLVSFIPATSKAVSRRGFDHAELLAYHVAQELDLPLKALFRRPKNKDQRELARHERITNMESRFELIDAHCPPRVLLIDDVYTTGSTLCSASKALLKTGARSVYCATFARVW